MVAKDEHDEPRACLLVTTDPALAEPREEPSSAVQVAATATSSGPRRPWPAIRVCRWTTGRALALPSARGAGHRARRIPAREAAKWRPGDKRGCRVRRQYAPVSLGDLPGRLRRPSNQVLPIGGTARHTAACPCSSFLRWSNVIEVRPRDDGRHCSADRTRSAARGNGRARPGESGVRVDHDESITRPFGKDD